MLKTFSDRFEPGFDAAAAEEPPSVRAVPFSAEGLTGPPRKSVQFTPDTPPVSTKPAIAEQRRKMV